MSAWDARAHQVPPAAPGDPRSLVLLHGTGGHPQEMLELGRELAPGWGRFAPHGREREGTVSRWFRRFGEGVFDVPNLIERAGDLAAEVDSALPRPSVRVALGYSNGANIAAGTLLLHPDAFDGAVLLASMLPLEPPKLPDLTGKSVLMVQGEKDAMAPMSSAQRLEALLKEAGAEVEVWWHAGGHGIPPLLLGNVADWLESRFNAKPTA